MAKVIVVEDDPDLAELFCLELTRAGNSVELAHSFDEAELLLERSEFDVAVLDVTLGDDQNAGHRLCQKVKALSEKPVIFLTSRSDELDQLLGFALGADDYLMKPISSKLLLARLQRHLKATESMSDSNKKVVEGIEIDSSSRSVRIDGVELRLTKTEFDLVSLLAERPKQIFTRAQIVDEIWGDWYGSDHQIDVHVSRLRGKIAAAGGPKVIRATKGVGLSFV